MPPTACRMVGGSRKLADVVEARIQSAISADAKGYRSSGAVRVRWVPPKSESDEAPDTPLTAEQVTIEFCPESGSD